MKKRDLFLNDYYFPEYISDEEFIELFKRYKNGDIEAKDIIVRYNIKFVIYYVNKKYFNLEFDKNDLVQVGNIGLLNAIETFDINRGIKFSTYLSKCIDNEILGFLRLEENHFCVDSFDKIICADSDFKLGEIIFDGFDLEESFINFELRDAILSEIEKLPDDDKKILTMYFGFFDSERYTQLEIANIFSMTHTYLSRKISKLVSDLGVRLSQKGYIDISNKKVNLSKKKKKNEKNSIYESFSTYSKEEVDEAVFKLSDYDKEIIFLKYGDGSSNYVSKLTPEQTKYYHDSIVRKIKRLLKNSSLLKKNVITSKVYEEAVRLSKSEEILNMFDGFSFEELIIIILKFGFVNNQYFSDNVIANFLNIDVNRVIEVSKIALLNYRDNINSSFCPKLTK